MLNEQRTRLFKIITLVFFSAVFFLLIARICLVPGNAGDYKLNEKINERNKTYALGNSFGFTDKERTVKKPKGIYRIAVIGDSFIWGSGLPYEKIWSHKLERKLLAEYDSIEVISWGKSGWSTLDEFNFFRQHGKNFDVDLLVIGWVDNDPDVGKIPQVRYVEPQKDFPLIFRIFPSLARRLENIRQNRSYNLWMSELYQPQNLKDYQEVLNQFHQYLVQKNIQVLVVMTPENLRARIKSNFDEVEPLIVKTGFACFNLYDITKSHVGHYSARELRANPVNGHPGDILTGEFANDVKNYLELNNYLHQVHKKSL